MISPQLARHERACDRMHAMHRVAAPGYWTKWVTDVFGRSRMHVSLLATVLRTISLSHCRPVTIGSELKGLEVATRLGLTIDKAPKKRQEAQLSQMVHAQRAIQVEILTTSHNCQKTQSVYVLESVISFIKNDAIF